tara:strand:- start:142 stop:417 length:276 start_codon:yes stop_codon:yes gene_type:complete
MIIKILEISETNYTVIVDSDSKTQHNVSLEPSYYKKLTLEKISKKKLIELSFEFLLARESNSSILSKFDLSLISNYFPEFENEIIIKIKEI